MIKERLKDFRYSASVPKGLYSKIVNYCRTEAGLNGVEFRQKSIGDIKIILATSHDVARRCAKSFLSTHPLTINPTNPQSRVWRQARCLKMIALYISCFNI